MSNSSPYNPKQQVPQSSHEDQSVVSQGRLLPVPEPERPRRNHLGSALLLGMLAGIVSGVVGIALSVLATTILDAPQSNFAGMEIAAVMFVVFGVLGWITSAVFLWYKFRSSAKTR